MANLRDLKKDVRFLTQEIISQAFFIQYINPNVDVESINSIITKVVSLHNNTIQKINEKPEISVKEHFRAIQENFVKNSFTLLKELNEMKK
jgi:hypothetical protein